MGRSRRHPASKEPQPCKASRSRAHRMPERRRLAGIRRRTSHSRVRQAGAVRAPLGAPASRRHLTSNKPQPCKASRSRPSPPGSAGVSPASDVEQATAVYEEPKPCAPHAGAPASRRHLTSKEPQPCNASRSRLRPPWERRRPAGIRRRRSHSRERGAKAVRTALSDRRRLAGLRRRTSHSRVTPASPCASVYSRSCSKSGALTVGQGRA
jgi:hypothetical protein